MDEYIGREAAKKELLSWALLVRNPGYMKRDDAMYLLDHIPAADVAPVVHGRWEPYVEEVEIYNAGGVAERKQTGWICGRCKSVESITRYYKTNYCPNCGAKMDLEALQ